MFDCQHFAAATPIVKARLPWPMRGGAMQNQEIIGWLGAAINGVGFAIYLRALFLSGSSTALGWLLATLVVTTSAFSQFHVTHSVALSASFVVRAFCCATAFALSLRNWQPVRKVDVLTVAVAVGVVTFAHLVPSWALACLAAYYLLSNSLFLRALRYGSHEPVLPWLIWCVGAIVQVASLVVAKASLESYVLPCVNLFCWGSVVVQIYRKPRPEPLLSVMPV
jgi:hypothetical protein